MRLLPLILGLLLICGSVWAYNAETYTGDISEAGGSSAVDGDGVCSADIDLAGFALKDTVGNIDISTSTDITGALTVSTTLGVTGVTTLSSTASVAGVLTCSDDLDMGRNDILAMRSVTAKHETTDTLPVNSAINGRSAWGDATGSNQVGGVLSLVGGQDSAMFTILNVDADATSDTVTFAWKNPTGNESVVLTAGTDFTCITDTSTCATALAAAIDGLEDVETSDSATTCYFSAVANAAKVEVYSHGPCIIYTLVCGNEGGGAGSVCNDTNEPTSGDPGGAVWVGAHNLFIHDADTGLNNTGGNILNIVAGGDTVLAVGASSVAVSGEYIYDSLGPLELGGDVISTNGLAATSDVMIKRHLEVDGTIYADSDLIVTGQMTIPTTVNATPTEPVVCASGTVGTMVYIDDSDDTAAAEWCCCQAITDSTYDWRTCADLTAACSLI